MKRTIYIAIPGIFEGGRQGGNGEKNHLELTQNVNVSGIKIK